MNNANTLTDAANQVRGLSIDAIHACSSGHLGLPLGTAEIGAVLFGEVLSYDPAAPKWLNRDRLILSAGHGSMFLYSWLHISGYDLSLDDLKNFRQLHSKTPGHPEFGETPGVEATTALGEESVIAKATASPNGVEGTAQVGTVALITNNTINVTGLQGTTALGTATAQANADVSVTGVQGTTALGETTETGTATVYAIGVQGTGDVGNVLVWSRIVPDPGTTWTRIAA